MPLLRIRRTDAEIMPVLRFKVHRRIRNGYTESGRDSQEGVSRGKDSAHGYGHDQEQGRASENPVRICKA